MTRPSDADMAAPKDPAEYRPRPLMGAGFWGMLVFGLLCVAAGVAFAVLVPRLLAARPAGRHVQAAAPIEQASAAPPPAVGATPAPPAGDSSGSAPAPDLGQLSERVAVLEAQTGQANRAAAAALAAATLVEASQGPRPFADEAAALRAVSPAAPELADLSRLAAVGAPSREGLAAAFPDYAARAASAARRPGEGASLVDRIVYGLSQVVMVRRIGEVAGDGPDAQLARAERLAADGDLERALAALDKLPPAAREAMAPWRARAERRAEIDRLTASLRSRALADFVAASRSGA